VSVPSTPENGSSSLSDPVSGVSGTVLQLLPRTLPVSLIPDADRSLLFRLELRPLLLEKK
jgi:hypothetical protein